MLLSPIDGAMLFWISWTSSAARETIMCVIIDAGSSGGGNRHNGGCRKCSSATATTQRLSGKPRVDGRNLLKYKDLRQSHIRLTQLFL